MWFSVIGIAGVNVMGMASVGQCRGCRLCWYHGYSSCGLVSWVSQVWVRVMGIASVDQCHRYSWYVMGM